MFANESVNNKLKIKKKFVKSISFPEPEIKLICNERRRAVLISVKSKDSNTEKSKMSDVKINDQTVADSPPLGKDPVHMICPHCSHEVWTEVETKPSIYAWISGIALALVG